MTDNHIDGKKVLGDIIVYNKYAKYIPLKKRRESWNEIVTRYLSMLVNRYPKLTSEIMVNGQYIYDKKVLPSMRALQFSGKAIEVNETRIYNCSYLPITHYKAFSETMFLLLSGTGVGYSVQKHHIDQLPEIQLPTQEMKYLIGDSIIGWADSVKVLLKAYLGASKVKPLFDYKDIRDKGERLITAGGRAPGHEPLKIALTKIEAILSQKKNGERLSTLEVHDIQCHLADAVLAGGIRRAAMIALFTIDDKEMLTCKHGNWWELNPQRGRANNSVTILRNRITKAEYDKLWETVKDSNSGEPGLYFTDDIEYGTNPCAEISLRPHSFCNLTEINAGTLDGQDDFNKRSEIASFFGTLQAGFTDFHYLRPIWKTNTEKDSLIGVSHTGIANGNIIDLNLEEAAIIAINENIRVAKLLDINPAARVTTNKPSGTTSALLGVSSGIHAWHDDYYIRNIQCKVGDELYNYFTKHLPYLIKIMDYDPNSAVIGIPQKAPEDAILRNNETSLELLERIKRFNIEWVKKGHISGPNTNNVSATVSVKPDEWDEVGEWMWKHKNSYNGISVLPYDGGTYKDAPFQTCTEEDYLDKIEYIRQNPIDLTQIIEEDDNTDLANELACSGNNCEVT